MKVCHLRTNHMKKPLGIDKAPEFSWKIESDEQNVVQTAYQIDVFDGGELVYSSGKVSSNKQSFIEYEGSLKSLTEYKWSVTVWDNQGNVSTENSIFETAFLSSDEITAKWSESPFERNESKLFTYGIENPVVLFDKSFKIEKSISKARLYATCYGVYRVQINGDRPDNREFAPEFTPYDKLLYYQTYDVSKLLKSGENKLEFTVGDGWFFCPQTSVRTKEIHERPAILYELHIYYTDGTKEKIVSDGTEAVRQTNIIFSDLFMGEKRDFTLPYSQEQTAIKQNYKKSHLVAQALPPIRPVELIAAKKIYISPKGETIVDFGQVIAGRARIKINAPKGAETTFEYTEVTDKDGNYFSTMSLRQCDTVISDGNEILHEALFTFHGFRYIRVTGLENVKKDDFTAVLLSTEKENTGLFECSDKRFERLYKNIRYSQKNNMMSIPTDCPTREKAGWTGDILIYSETAALNEEMTPFLTSWLHGLMCDQMSNGVIPLISPLTKLYEMVAMQTMAPFGAKEQTGIAGWGDAIVWVPYSMYRITGNKLILEECFSAMQGWCDYVIHICNTEKGSDLPDEIDRWLFNTGFHFGEWLVPGKLCEGFEICKETVPYIAPYYAYKTMCIMSEIAEVLGENSKYYYDVAEKMKVAIIKGLFDSNRLPDDYMGAYALAFAFDLVPEKYEEKYKQKLLSLIEQNNFCLATGFLATPFLLPALDKIGRHDLALKILTQENKPSWLYEVKMGATTIWENWLAIDDDGTPIKTSFDHYAFGVIDGYICHSICGIDSDTPGYEHIVIKPDEKTFASFKRTFASEKGKIIVQKDGDSLNVAIPCNSTATVHWKNAEYKIGSGKYIFN